MSSSGRGRGGPPQWWPENEPWPPRGRSWAGGATRHRFMRRMAFVFVLFVLAVVGGLTLLLWLLAGALGALSPQESVRPGGPPFALALLLLVVVAVTLGRAARRFASPVGELIEAAQRVEAGDYSVRVDVRGPRMVRSLGRAFNAMTTRLAANEDQRRRLLADVTHELRTPLTVVQGNLEALLDGVHPVDTAHVRPILDETRVLARLVEDLRILSLAEAGALTLHREPIDVGALASETAASLRTQADRAGVSLVTAVAPDLPAADADPVRAREVLVNLIANALRYTPAGGTIGVTVAASGAALRVGVRDSGSGIAADDLPHVFDRFHKSAESRGAGLGLAIAKGLVVAHGGEIGAESVPGQGTEISFTLPIAR